jgi:glycerol-3-phosphate O-acyltransferase
LPLIFSIWFCPLQYLFFIATLLLNLIWNKEIFQIENSIQANRTISLTMNEYHSTLAKTALKTDKFFKKTFSRFIVDGPPIPDEVTKSPSMIVSTHRSHTDYFILGTVFHLKGIVNLRFAAGNNLTEFPYLGRKFKQWGAFAVERDRAGGKNYVRALCAQVVEMLEKGDNIIVFPESGRSYKGAMMDVRGVILSALVIAQSHSLGQKHFMVPVAISYEQLPELLYFKMLEKGKAIRKEKGGLLKRIYGNILYFGSDLIAFAKFLSANKFGKNYGVVYIDYAQPVAIQDIIDIETINNPDSKNEITAHRVAVQKICEYMHSKFIMLYRILPMHVMAAIMIRHGSSDSIKAREFVPGIVEILEKANCNLKSLANLSPAEIVEQGIHQLHKMKAIEARNGTIHIKEESILAYYAAAIPVIDRSES